MSNPFAYFADAAKMDITDKSTVYVAKDDTLTVKELIDFLQQLVKKIRMIFIRVYFM
jgi:enolase